MRIVYTQIGFFRDCCHFLFYKANSLAGNNIYDGDETSPLIGAFTGLLPPPPIYGTSASMVLIFISDGANQDRGFRMQYFISKYFCDCFQYYRITCHLDGACNGGPILVSSLVGTLRAQVCFIYGISHVHHPFSSMSSLLPILSLI